MAKDKADKAMAATAAAPEATGGVDRSSYGEVVLDTFLWRGGSSTNKLIGRIVATGTMQTKFKSVTNPDGVMEYVSFLLTEPGAWKDDKGNDVLAPVDAIVKVPVTGGLEGLYNRAKAALRAGKAPEAVLGFTGKVKPTPQGEMKLYALQMEPASKWPDLKDVAADFLFEATASEFVLESAAAPKQLTQ